MEFLELAKARYSVRKFTDVPVPQAFAEQILQAGLVAPTARNNQPQVIYVLDDAKNLAALGKCTTCVYGATLAYLICYDRTICWQRPFDGKLSGDIDASIIATHMMLEAASLGIGSTWVMHFDPAAARSEFRLPDNLEPTAILVMGYAAEDAVPSPRHTEFRDAAETVVRNPL